MHSVRAPAGLILAAPGVPGSFQSSVAPGENTIDPALPRPLESPHSEAYVAADLSDARRQLPLCGSLMKKGVLYGTALFF